MLWSKSLRENICGNFYSRKRILRIAGKIAKHAKIRTCKNFRATRYLWDVVLNSYNGSAVHPVNWNSPLIAELPCARRPITKKNWSSIPENLLLTSPYGLSG